MKQGLLLGFYVMLFSVVVCLGAATTGKIAGTVTDANTGEPLPGANILIQGTQMGAASDLDGSYFILNVPPGTYTLEAQMIGYKKEIRTSVQVNIDVTTEENFKLQTEVIEGEEVTVVAQKPVVDKYVTASKQVVSSEDIQNSYVTDIEQAVDIQQGVGYMGTIRGGFGVETAYIVDGMELREGGSNSNYTGMNISSVEEMQVLTGGYNAEYGRAMGGIVNVVTKTARDRFHGSLNYRFRPSGIYHWGGHIYGDDLYEYTVMADPAYWEDINPGGQFNDLSAAEKADIWINKTMNAPWAQPMKDYDKRSTHEVEGTLYGPITNKLSFMLSGRYNREAPIFPQLFEYNPEWHGEMNLHYDLQQNTRISLKVMHGGYDNAGRPTTNFASSEDIGVVAGSNGPYVTSAFSLNKYYLLGSWGLGTMKAPEYVRMWSGFLKGTHTFNPSTFLEVKYNYFDFLRDADWRRNDLSQEYGLDPIAYINQETYTDNNGELRKYVDYYPEYMQFNPGGMPWFDRWTFQTYPQNLDYFYQRKHTFSADLTSQITDVHQIKGGAMFNLNLVDRFYGFGPHYVIFGNQWQPTHTSPWEGAAYIQDRIETKGMIINLGLRLDMYNANTAVSDDIYDPAGVDKGTPGNIGQCYVSRGDPWNWVRLQEGDQYAVMTETHAALSPRVGVSHPISENTVLHFMYGHFKQRPSWVKIVQNAGLTVGNNHFLYGFNYDMHPWPEGWLDGSGKYDEYNSRGFYRDWIEGGNPALDFESIIQYEVGFEQNIADKLRLDVTMFYKDGKNLTSAGIYNSESAVSNYRTAVGHSGWSARGRARLAASRDRGGSAGAWKTGMVGVSQNNYWQDVRGIEVTTETRFNKWFNARLDYSLSYSQTGIYGLQNAYRPGEDGTQFSLNTRWGANNHDGGNDANNNEYWNPNNSLKLSGNVFTPKDLGPRLGNTSLLGDWNLTFNYTYAQGFEYTYYSPDQIASGIPIIPNNRRWKPFHNTNFSLSKAIPVGSGLRAILSVKVINLFDQNQLRLPGNLQNWHELGLHNQRNIGSGDYQEKRDDVWRWYNFRQLPRMIYYSLSFEF